MARTPLSSCRIYSFLLDPAPMGKPVPEVLDSRRNFSWGIYFYRLFFLNRFFSLRDYGDESAKLFFLFVFGTDTY
jgi:hypothetical protein